MKQILFWILMFAYYLWFRWIAGGKWIKQEDGRYGIKKCFNM